jgi:hypothetical protein
MPCVAIPAAKVMRVVLQFLHQKHVLERIHHEFQRTTRGIAGVIPIIFSFFRAKSKRSSQNIYFEVNFLLVLKLFPSCCNFSARGILLDPLRLVAPFPLVVIKCKI